nr:immunoglobulin light chain junction region [Macaca mulatta]
SQQESNWPTF